MHQAVGGQAAADAGEQEAGHAGGRQLRDRLRQLQHILRHQPPACSNQPLS